MFKLKTQLSIFSAIIVLAACQAATSHRFKSASLSSSASFSSGPYDQTVYGQLSKPSGEGPFPVVILLHTCGGLTLPVERDWPYFLRGLGYAVFAIDSYGPRGMTTCRYANPVERLEWQSQDAIGALDSFAELPEIDENRVAVMGFSQGGRAINTILIPYLNSGLLKSSLGLEFKAAISVYGACGALKENSKTPFPLMQILGDQDPLVFQCRGVDQVENVELNILPGVYHAFDNMQASGRRDVGGKYMLYSGTGVEKARELTEEFLGKHLRK